MQNSTLTDSNKAPQQVMGAMKSDSWPLFIAENFKVFMEEVAGPNYNPPLTNVPFHDELDDIISNPLYKKICIAYPRGHGKSTHLSVGFPLWAMAKNRDLRILLVSSTATIASGFITEILNHIEGNEKYAEWSKAISQDGTPVHPKRRKVVKMEEKWSGGAFTIDRPTVGLKDPTMQAIGLFGSSLSRRADIIICDDVINQENSETEEQRQKIKDWIYTTVMPILVPGGRFLYLGNTWHQDDLVSNLLHDPLFDYRDKKASIMSDAVNQNLWQNWANIRLDDEKELVQKLEDSELYYEANKKEMDEGIQLMWPERFTYKDLYLIRMQNPYSFARMYQCDPSKRPNQKIKDDWLEKAIMKGKDLILQDEPRRGLTMRDTTAGLDLAISQKKGSDDTVFFTLDMVQYGDGAIEPGDFVIRNIERGKYTPAQVRELVVQKYGQIHHSGIRVESVQYQESMAIDLSGFGLPIKSYSTGKEKNDPEVGVYSIANILERGKFIIPYNRQDARTIALSTQLMNELRAWPDGHTGDSLMALWFAYAEMRTHIGMRMSHPRIDLDDKRDLVESIEHQNLSPEEKRKEYEKLADLEAMKLDEQQRRGDTYKPRFTATVSDKPYVRKFSF